MKLVLQRVRSASVTVAGRQVSAIGQGYLLLLGVAQGDTEADGAWLARKVVGLRLFPDVNGRLDRTLAEVGGAVLVVSQFTLLAALDKGARPSFHRAEAPEPARVRYERFCAQLGDAMGPGAAAVARGEFGADMQVELVNDGPLTLLIDTRDRAGGDAS